MPPSTLPALLTAALLSAVALSGPVRAEDAPAPTEGVVEVSSAISPVDACNRAQGQRPAGATVTGMHYRRPDLEEERLFSCRVSWSTSPEARPTGRPILFGPTP